MPKGKYKRTKKHRRILAKNSSFKKGLAAHRIPHSVSTKKKIGIGNAREKNGNWNGGRYIRKDGYILVRVNGSPRTEHRVVMEKHLGRLLLPSENVHHKNGVRHDNRIENLELWTDPPMRGIRVKDAISYAEEIIKRYKNIKKKF